MTKADREQRVSRLMDDMKQRIVEEFGFVDEKFVGKISFTFHCQTGSISGSPEVTKRGETIRIDTRQ